MSQREFGQSLMWCGKSLDQMMLSTPDRLPILDAVGIANDAELPVALEVLARQLSSDSPPSRSDCDGSGRPSRRGCRAPSPHRPPRTDEGELREALEARRGRWSGRSAGAWPKAWWRGRPAGPGPRASPRPGCAWHHHPRAGCARVPGTSISSATAQNLSSSALRFSLPEGQVLIDTPRKPFSFGLAQGARWRRRCPPAGSARWHPDASGSRHRSSPASSC